MPGQRAMGVQQGKGMRAPRGRGLRIADRSMGAHAWQQILVGSPGYQQPPPNTQHTCSQPPHTHPAPACQVFYNNLLSLPFIALIMAGTGELRGWLSEPDLRNPTFMAVAAVSGLIGFGIRCGQHRGAGHSCPGCASQMPGAWGWGVLAAAATAPCLPPQPPSATHETDNCRVTSPSEPGNLDPSRCPLLPAASPRSGS